MISSLTGIEIARKQSPKLHTMKGSNSCHPTAQKALLVYRLDLFCVIDIQIHRTHPTTALVD